MNLKKIICLLLTLAMLTLTFASCAESGEEKGTGTGDASGAASEAGTLDPVEEALERIGKPDWGGETFTILYTDDIAGYKQEIFADHIAAGDNTVNAVINDAVYERNTMFAERCNMKLSLVGRGSSAVPSAVASEVNNNLGDYQMFTCTANATASMGTACQLYNYLAFEDVDYEAPWWDLGTLEFALCGKVFWMNGAWNIMDDEVTFVMMFNKKLAEEYRLSSPYDKVRSGDWTLDYFLTNIKNVATDLDGDGKMTADDVYGFCSPNTIGNTFFYGAGLQYVINSRDMDAPELALVDSQVDKALEVLDKVRVLTLGGDSYVAKAGDEALASDCFKKGRSIFYVEAASYLTALNRDMDGDYGVVPIPKYDSKQVDYRTWTHPIGSAFSMPASLKNTEQMGAIIETLCVLSQQKLTPAYYDNMLTKRNVRDAESSEMLEGIVRNRVYDLAIYFASLGMDSLFSQAALSSGGSFGSQYAPVQKRFERNIGNIIKKLQKMDN